jgi:3-keto-disaccharide hydrolase
MKTYDRVASVLVSILTVILAAPSLLHAQEESREGWTTLFNGKDLDGWKFHLGKEGAGNDGTFTVKDRVLICNGKPSGYMVSEKSYGSYTLQVEFAFKKPEGLKNDADFRGNSGCLIHIGKRNALGVWPRSIEVQGANRSMGLILPIPRNLKCTHTFNREAMAKVIKPVGQFNKMEIQVKAGDMVISLNGTVVSTVSDCELTEGPIGLQSEGVETHWKTIRIRER